MNRAHRALLVVGIVATVASCGQDQAFRVDERVKITTPKDRSEVRLPVSLEWRADDIEEPSFAVFVDRAPVRPGEPVVASSTRTNAVYTTSETEFVIEQVAEDDGTGRELHRATIVLLDPSGRRIGESAWDVTFEVQREKQK